jgi:hypothetical protein
MATKDYGQTYYPTAGSTVNPAGDMETLAESLEGRTVVSFASTSARDTALASLTTDQKKGVVAHVQGTGWFGYDGSAWKQFSTMQVKCGAYNGTAEGNNMFRVLAADCFFNGSPPTSIVCMWTGTDLNYYCSFGQFDGGGALIKVTNNVTGAQITSGGNGSFFWIAAKA